MLTEVAEATQWPDGFTMDLEKGLKRTLDLTRVPQLVSGPFVVLAMTRTPEGTGWGLLIQLWDPDRKAKQVVLRLADISGDGGLVARQLSDLGLTIYRVSDLAEALRLVSTPSRARLVTRPGWNGDQYVLGREPYAPDTAEPLAFEAVEAAPPPQGTLEGWRNTVARLAVGNSRLVVAISLAFAGPLLRPLGSDGFGLHLCGPSSCGKTTTLHAARSVAGFKLGSWRATDNGLEGEAVAANDGSLMLDELGECDPWVVGRVAYMLANGSGKGRAEQTGARKPRAEWRIIYLSTGELSLADKISEDGRTRRATAGQAVRLIEVSAVAGAGHGVFEALHEFQHPAELAKAITASATDHSGHAIRAFLSALTADLEAARELANSVRKRFRAAASDKLTAQASRVREHFGLIAAAGELATHFGVTGWEPEQATWAAERLFEAWLSERGEGDHEEREAVRAVQRYLERFAGLEVDIPSCWKGEARGQAAFLIVSGEWRTAVCAGLNDQFVAEVLRGRGLLIADDGRLQVKVRRGGVSMNVYAVSQEVLAL